MPEYEWSVEEGLHELTESELRAKIARLSAGIHRLRYLRNSRRRDQLEHRRDHLMALLHAGDYAEDEISPQEPEQDQIPWWMK